MAALMAIYTSGHSLSISSLLIWVLYESAQLNEISPNTSSFVIAHMHVSNMQSNYRKSRAILFLRTATRRRLWKCGTNCYFTRSTNCFSVVLLSDLLGHTIMY